VRAGLRRPSGAVITLFLLLPLMSCAKKELICAIDMGSNNFRRIVGTFAGGRYSQTIETATLGVGDDVAANGRISEPKLVEIEKTLARFKSSRLIVAVSMMEAFGYTQLELIERELGAGLIIEAGLMAADSP
jgi:hypothetical protein